LYKSLGQAKLVKPWLVVKGIPAIATFPIVALDVKSTLPAWKPTNYHWGGLNFNPTNLSRKKKRKRISARAMSPFVAGSNQALGTSMLA